MPVFRAVVSLCRRHRLGWTFWDGCLIQMHCRTQTPNDINNSTVSKSRTNHSPLRPTYDINATHRCFCCYSSVVVLLRTSSLAERWIKKHVIVSLFEIRGFKVMCFLLRSVISFSIHISSSFRHGRRAFSLESSVAPAPQSGLPPISQPIRQASPLMRDWICWCSDGQARCSLGSIELSTARLWLLPSSFGLNFLSLISLIYLYWICCS